MEVTTDGRVILAWEDIEAIDDLIAAKKRAVVSIYATTETSIPPFVRSWEALKRLTGAAR